MSDWHPIETAPKDGATILFWTPRGEAFLVRWNPKGTAWVDAEGCFSKAADHVEETGTWDTWNGWFQPDEVSGFCWQPIPGPPTA